MADPTTLVLERLRAAGHDPKQMGNGWSCRCPGHEDRRASLSVSTGDDGRVLLRCHAGCSFDLIVAALGVDKGETFAEPGRVHQQPRAARSPTTKTTFATWEQAVCWMARRRSPPIAVWHYHDASGTHVGVVARWSLPDGQKDVKPAARQSDGSWAAAGMPTPRPLYALADVVSSGSVVYVTEGEKAADAVRSLGLVATTSAHGANSARGTDWTPLDRRDVVVLPDHDDPGEAYAAEVVGLATAAGAASVRVVRLADVWPAMPAKGDAYDWIEAHDGTDPADLRAALERLVAAAAAAPAMPAGQLEHAPDDGPAWCPFPVDLLPDPVALYVNEKSTAIGCDASFVALPLLAYAAGAIGTTRSCRVNDDWLEPAVVWAAIVGEPGSQKTPAFKAAGHFADVRQRVAFDEHAEQRRQHERAMLEYDAAVAGWKREVAKGRGGPPPDKPVCPAATRYVVSDTTIEALVPILVDNARGVVVSVDELAGWMDGFGQYKAGGRGADAAKWLSMHNAGPVVVDRKGGATLYVPSAAVSVVGGIQPRVLGRSIGQQYRENGLLARLLLAMPPRRPKTWSTGNTWTTTTADVAGVFDVLYSLEPGPPVDLDPDATEVFKAFYAEHARTQAAAKGDVAALLAKIEAYAARLSLIVHLLGWAGRKHDRERIGAADVAAGVALARWFAAEAQRVYHVLEHGDDATEDAVAELVGWIDAAGGVASVRDVARGLRRYRGTAAAEAGLRRLVAAGLARWESTSTGGRPADAVRLLATKVAQGRENGTFGTVATGAVPATGVV